MPSLRPKRACPTPVFPSHGSKIKGQERGAQTSKFRHKTFGLVEGSKALGTPVSSSMASSSKASSPMAPGSPALAASAEICSCQSEWQTQDQQIKALHEEATKDG